MSEKKLAVFDIDGTIAVHGAIPDSIIAGLETLQAKGYLTTVSTGRSYVRAQEALGDNFDKVVSSNSLIIVEHGSKIVDREGHVVYADYLKSNELDHIVDFSRVNKDMIRLIWFGSPDPMGRIQVWCKYPEDIEKEIAKRGHYAEIFHCSFEELRTRLDAFPISNVSAKLEAFVSVENLKLRFTRSEIDIFFQDSMMEYLRNIADKSAAVLYLEKHHNIAVENMLIAGNAINDVDMLNLGAGKRILVGVGPNTEVVMGYLIRPEEVIRVESPEDLGNYLQRLEA